MKFWSFCSLDTPSINPEKPLVSKLSLISSASILSSVSKPIRLNLCSGILKVIHSSSHEHLKEDGHFFKSLLRPAFPSIRYYYFSPPPSKATVCFDFWLVDFCLFFYLLPCKIVVFRLCVSRRLRLCLRSLSMSMSKGIRRSLMPLALWDSFRQHCLNFRSSKNTYLNQVRHPYSPHFSFSLGKEVCLCPLAAVFQTTSTPSVFSPLHEPFMSFPQCLGLSETCSVLPRAPVFRSGLSSLRDPYLPNCLPSCSCYHSSTMASVRSKRIVRLLASPSPTLKSCHRHISLVSNTKPESGISFLLFHLCYTQELVSNDTEAKS